MEYISSWNVTHGKEHISHILLHSLLVRDNIQRLVHTCTFSRQNGLVDPEAAGRHGE